MYRPEALSALGIRDNMPDLCTVFARHEPRQRPVRVRHSRPLGLLDAEQKRRPLKSV